MNKIISLVNVKEYQDFCNTLEEAHRSFADNGGYSLTYTKVDKSLSELTKISLEAINIKDIDELYTNNTEIEHYLSENADSNRSSEDGFEELFNRIYNQDNNVDSLLSIEKELLERITIFNKQEYDIIGALLTGCDYKLMQKELC